VSAGRAVAVAEASRPGGGVALSAEQEALRAEAGEWAREVLRPRAAELEWEADPRARVGWELLEEASRRGWRTMTVPERYGGADADPLTLCVLVEELTAGDMGLAVLIDQTLKVARIVSWLASPEQQDAFFPALVADPRAVLAICFTEPAHGSDYILDVPGFHFDTSARRDGDGWILTGHKRFISNGADASFYVVFATTDPSKDAREGTSTFLVPRTAEGLEVVRIHEKIAQRTINNAEIRFNDIRLGPEALLGDVHHGYTSARQVLRESAIEAGATALGAGQAAYELALAHAATRVQGGRPLIEHANVGVRLARMATRLEAARSLVWRAAREVTEPGYDHRFGSMCKVFAADVAVEVGLEAMEIHGGLAVMTRECGVDKFVRDAMSFLHSDGAQDSHLLRVAGLTRERIAAL
jgi:alkylation response protein AidB-like acyl-CoA dehydrogenase